MRILVSGAGIAGPVLAYWLDRYGFRPTVVERMGLLGLVRARSTGTERMTLLRDGARPVHIEVDRVLGVAADRQVEILRDELSEICHDAARDRVEYLFGDSIASVDDRGPELAVTFERGAPRAFDLVIGADGLHSRVRRLVFGDERRFAHYIGGYTSVLTVPGGLAVPGRMTTVAAPGRIAAVYRPRHLDEARAVLMFRSPRRLDYHRRDTGRQKELLREHFAGIGAGVPRLLAELDRTPAFYFDEITQLRMDGWSRGRVSLVGDAGYCPGPAVGASTSMAVVGAYVLAGELAAAGGDHTAAFGAYERAMADYVRRGRAFAVRMVEQVIPGSPARVWAGAQAMRLLGLLPAARALTRRGNGMDVHDDVAVPSYPG
ncbi:FAD-dependent monooxygenase [Allonocardiopsis opalescens]|uniref:2-polyprenyl-6-methoxyphenol hydroxylase-like FAD-dependent oxidoreductase n=1 Tax=Allonocardiopsis opalescens TaxID=1144618 RepID=A0A2T0QES4_9ACTN|nr:FAD-dependent monooxygenase [Allonocardiopsis opalescens]PRY02444.1 2-polyprenyl-6-methoxyphenol hydroxylase-like FAD-dependent oxidoreductase [Allonocardiopsis opalescens]